MKVTLTQIKDILLVASVLVIIGLILFKDEKPIVIYDHEESIKRFEDLEKKIDSIDSSVELVIMHKENEKMFVDTIVGVNAHDSTFASKFGFKPSRH